MERTRSPTFKGQEYATIRHHSGPLVWALVRLIGKKDGYWLAAGTEVGPFPTKEAAKAAAELLFEGV